MSEKWIKKLEECINLVPQGTTCQEIIDQLRELWKSNKNKCILCNPQLIELYDPRRKAIANSLLKQINNKYIKMTYNSVMRYICEQCFNKLDILDMINAHLDVVKKKNEEDIKRRKEWSEKNLLTRISNMQNQKGTPSADFYTLREVITKTDSENLQTMDYYEFLGTIYWKVVRRYVLWKRQYKCELCNSNGKLNVHHKSYEHRGYELYHLEDLILLCQECHSIHHDKLTE